MWLDSASSVFLAFQLFILSTEALAQNLFDRRRHHNFSSSFRSGLNQNDRNQYTTPRINSASNLNPVHGLAPISVHDHPFVNQSIQAPPIVSASNQAPLTYRDSQPLNRRPSFQSMRSSADHSERLLGMKAPMSDVQASESNLSPLASPIASSKKIVCYYTNWSQYRPGIGRYVPENIDPFICTHIVFAFGWMKNNKVSSFDAMDESKNGKKGLYDRITELKLVNPKLKVIF